MPLPRRLAQINRSVTNRILGRMAGWMPGFAIVLHTGRHSGRAYRTPVNAFRMDGGYRIALTYGANSDWVRNVMAAGGCQIVTRRTRHSLTEPRILNDPQPQVGTAHRPAGAWRCRCIGIYATHNP